MGENSFKSLEDLYKKVKPALTSKRLELNRNNIKFINEEDIWNYLKDNYWCKKSGLTLGELVNDIITVSTKELIDYKNNYLVRNKDDNNR